MRVQALSYIGVRTKSLDDWASYGVGLLGLQRIEKTRSTMAFRMDDCKQRIIVEADGGAGLGVFGWEVADAEALDAIAARVEQSGTRVTRGSRALVGARCVTDLIECRDPIGNRLEIVHGLETSSDAFAPGRPISGFRTGPLGLGHVALCIDNIRAINGMREF